MKNTESSNGSNNFTKETAPGSGQFSPYFRDVTVFYRGLTYGFFLDIPDEFPEHLLDVIKPHLTYADFDYGKALTVRRAIGTAVWMVLPLEDKTFLDKCELVKVAAAHIQLLRRD